MQNATRVKGSVILSRLEFVSQRGGPLLLEQVKVALTPQDRASVEFIFPTGWYDLGLNNRLDAAIAHVLSPNDPQLPFLEMGRASADINLGDHHASFVQKGNPHGLLAASGSIYRLYYDEGHREYEKTGPTSATLRTIGAPLATIEDCLTVVGWHVRAIEMCGGKNVRVDETLCRAKGGAHCQYECSWSM